MKSVGVFILLSILIAVGLVRWSLGAQMNSTEPVSVQTVEVKKVAADIPVADPTPPSATTTPTSTPLPTSAKVTLGFTSQAPLSIWDALHEDTCEEASLLMVKYFQDDKALPSKNEVDQQLISWVHWEQSKGMGPSITLEQLNTVASHYGLQGGKVIQNISTTDIKREIAAGRPVILGMAGKILDNPNFRNGGPNYHMLVVTGYDATGFITNDPGTRLGHDFHYTYDGFYNAIHDWNAKNIMNGGRNMLVFR